MAPQGSNESNCRIETYEKVIQISLLEIVMVVSLLGNGSVFILLARFKFMRTSANILVANLAIWDILQALTQTPLYIGYAVLQSPNIRGRTSSLLIVFSTLFVRPRDIICNGFTNDRSRYGFGLRNEVYGLEVDCESF